MPRQRLPVNSEAAIRQQQQMRDDAEKQRRNIINYYASLGYPADRINIEILPLQHSEGEVYCHRSNLVQRLPPELTLSKPRLPR
jgi:hypothetical protein